MTTARATLLVALLLALSLRCADDESHPPFIDSGVPGPAPDFFAVGGSSPFGGVAGVAGIGGSNGFGGVTGVAGIGGAIGGATTFGGSTGIGGTDTTFGGATATFGGASATFGGTFGF